MLLGAFAVVWAEALPTPTIREIKFRKCQFEHHRIGKTHKGLLTFRLLVKLFCGSVTTRFEIRVEGGENGGLMRHEHFAPLPGTMDERQVAPRRITNDSSTRSFYQMGVIWSSEHAPEVLPILT